MGIFLIILSVVFAGLFGAALYAGIDSKDDEMVGPVVMVFILVVASCWSGIYFTGKSARAKVYYDLGPKIYEYGYGLYDSRKLIIKLHLPHEVADGIGDRVKAIVAGPDPYLADKEDRPTTSSNNSDFNKLVDEYNGLVDKYNESTDFPDSRPYYAGGKPASKPYYDEE